MIVPGGIADLPSSVVIDSSGGPSANQIPQYTGTGRETEPLTLAAGTNMMLTEADGTLTFSSSGGSGGSGIPTGWIDVTAAPYNADKTGATDCTSAINAAIAAAYASPSYGGTVYFPPGTYLISTGPISLDLKYGIKLLGAGPALQAQEGSTKLLFSGSSGHLMTCYSGGNIEIAGLVFQYNNASYTGDLIDLDGAPHGADVENVHIHHCASRYGTSGPLTAGNARSIVRLSQFVIGTIELCQWTGATNELRVGDPGGTYVNVLQIEKCEFDESLDAHILIGTADGESLTIRDNTFEAGNNTTAIRGATIAVDGSANALYNPRIEGNWFGDAGANTNWIDSLITQSGVGYSGHIVSNRFATVHNGKHLILKGRWTVESNSFEAGTIYTAAVSNNSLDLLAINNYYNAPNYVFDPTTFPSGYPANFWVAIGEGADSNTRSEIYLQNKLGIHALDSTLSSAAADGDLVIGARAGAGYETPVAPGLIYKGQRPGSTSPALILQSPWNGSHGELHLLSGSAPTLNVWLQDGKMGFFGATPTAVPSASGETSGYTAGTSTAVTIDGKVTGGVGMAAPTGVAVAAVASGGSFAAGTYYWKITAKNAAGQTVGSSEVSSAIIANGSATLTWTPVAGATGYNVYRATSSGGESTSPALVSTISSGTTATYTDTGTAVSTGAVPASSTALTAYTIGDIVAGLKQLGLLAG